VSAADYDNVVGYFNHMSQKWPILILVVISRA
jgi:hypothetical protein